MASACLAAQVSATPAPAMWRGDACAQAQAAARIGVPGTPAITSVWYRGTPAGTPRAEDLAAIRAIGFDGLTWPSRDVAGTAEVYRLAAAANLLVTLRIASVPLTPASALKPEQAVDINVASTKPEMFRALVWRAVAHGARVVSFDAGTPTGTGLDVDGKRAAWLNPAIAIAAQLSAQARLVEEWSVAADRVTVEGPSSADLDLMLLGDNRSWVLVVTNTSHAPIHAVAHLPAGVPSALWVNLLDGSLLSMINQESGPKWSLELEAGAARVYVVNRAGTER